MSNLNETLQFLMTDARQDISDRDRPSAELMSDIEEARFEIEGLFAEWKAPAEGVAYAIEELDENFQFAGEEYLNVCDLVEEALIARSHDLLDDAARTYRKARLLLKAADQAAAERFQNWVARSQGGKPK